MVDLVIVMPIRIGGKSRPPAGVGQGPIIAASQPCTTSGGCPAMKGIPNGAMNVSTVLTIVSGLCWTWVYMRAILVGRSDRTYAIPFVALALNLAWEVIYAVVGVQHATSPYDSLSVQAYVNVVWALLDVGVLLTFLRYGQKSPPWSSYGRRRFLGLAGLVVLAAFALQFIIRATMGTRDGATFAAFAQNLLMSALFLALWFRRRNVGQNGQRLDIAISKMVGSGAAWIIFGILTPNQFVAVVGAMILAIDGFYCVLLGRSSTSLRLEG